MFGDPIYVSRVLFEMDFPALRTPEKISEEMEEAAKGLLLLDSKISFGQLVAAKGNKSLTEALKFLQEDHPCLQRFIDSNSFSILHSRADRGIRKRRKLQEKERENFDQTLLVHISETGRQKVQVERLENQAKSMKRKKDKEEEKVLRLGVELDGVQHELHLSREHIKDLKKRNHDLEDQLMQMNEENEELRRRTRNWDFMKNIIGKVEGGKIKMGDGSLEYYIEKDRLELLDSLKMVDAFKIKSRSWDKERVDLETELKETKRQILDLRDRYYGEVERVRELEEELKRKKIVNLHSDGNRYTEEFQMLALGLVADAGVFMINLSPIITMVAEFFGVTIMGSLPAPSTYTRWVQEMGLALGMLRVQEALKNAEKNSVAINVDGTSVGGTSHSTSFSTSWRRTFCAADLCHCRWNSIG